MIKTRTNRVFYTSPADAYDKFLVAINVQDSYEPVMPKFFSMTNTPPFFEDPFSSNMCRANVPLKVLVDIHAGKYIYELINPEQDVPDIVTYLTWFIDTYSRFEMDKDQELTMKKVIQTRDFFKRWQDNVNAANERKANNGKRRVRSFAEGGYAK